MSIVELRVELPAYSHSFIIQVPLTYTIFDVKGEITRSCPGAPRAEGQRIIWRGRVLGDDEKVEDIWKSSEDSRVIHLAVNPSAWPTGPPPIPGRAPEALGSTLASLGMSPPPMPVHSSYFVPHHPSAPPMPHQPMSPMSSVGRTSGTPSSIPEQHPMAWVMNAHQNAILALTSGKVSKDAVVGRATAVYVLEKNGFSWPGVFDEVYPGTDAEGNMLTSLPEGVRYQIAEGQTALHLQNPGATPNIFQAHALKVLTHTFPLFSLPIPTHTTTTTSSTSGSTIPTAVPREVNQLLQQLGLPPLRVAGAQPERRTIFMREISLRALLAPIMMLIFRTVLLVYFVSPTRKPLFGLMVGAWIVYEAWGPLRAALNGAAEREAAQARPALARQGQEDGAVAAGDAQGQNAAAAQPGALAQDGAVGAAARPGVRHAAYAGAMIDSLAYINIPNEAQVLAASERTPPSPPPSFVHKVTTFVALLLLTLHPAVWDRRRVVVRQREGRLRTEANAREREPDAPTPEAVEGEAAEGAGTEQRSQQERMAAVRADLIAVHARRPRWVQDYVERARSGEWVDD